MEQYRGPEITPHIYSQLIFKKVTKCTHWTKGNLFNCVGKFYPHKNEMKYYPYHTPYTVINSK